MREGNGKKAGDSAGCPYAKKCGGCSGAAMPYKDTLTEKQKRLRKQLARFGTVEPVTGMAEPFHYRNKVHAAFGRSNIGQILCGTYEAKSHKIIPIETCLIEDKVSREIVLTVRDLVRALKLKIYDEDLRQGFVRHVLVRRAFGTGEILVALVTADSRFPLKKAFVKGLLDRHPEITTIVMNINDRRTSMVLGDREIVLYGSGRIRDRLCGRDFALSARSFYQVNPVQTEVLYRKAIELADLTGRETVLDAYCGIGTIGMIAADKAKSVIGVELNPEAVRDAIQNAKINRLKNVRIFRGDAGKVMTEMAAEGEHFDVVFMDPPRSGSDEAFLKAVMKAAPRKVVYVSCNPETLARDLTTLTRRYHVERICPVDMFPFAEPHVETVVCLSDK